jgi:2'-5' RNA ligase
MHQTRRQLTLFIAGQNEAIEKIREEFNPEQYHLIPTHVTLCREDEIEPIEKVIENIRFLSWPKPIRIEFDPPERFENGKGVFIPAKRNNPDFYALRKAVLNGLNEFPGKLLPHITLMHPRNSTCSDIIFERIKKHELPTELIFNKISLIEQRNGGKWIIIEEFPIMI